MTPAVQQIIAFAAVVLALAWLVLDRLRRRRQQPRCASCTLAATLRRPDPLPPRSAPRRD